MRALGIILAGGNNEGRLGKLTWHRAAAALPIACSFRAIDFTLSNMAGSGVGKVAVITQYNARSLRDHLTSSKWWDFGRKQGGLFVLTPFISSTSSSWYRGTADSIYQNISFLLRSNEEYVIISGGDSIYKADYRKIIEHHSKKEADITVVYKPLERNDLNKFGIVETDEDERIISFEEKPYEPKVNTVSLGIYVMKRELLIHLLQDMIPKGQYDFVRDILVAKLRELKIYGYRFNDYWDTLTTGGNAYYKINMDFLDKHIRDFFVNSDPYIETKAKDEAPAKYNIGAKVRNTISGSGTIFNSEVNDSVIFRKVYIGEQTIVNNSIIMEGCRIGNNCRIEYAILDKKVIVSDGINIIGTKEEPIVIGKNEIL